MTDTSSPFPKSSDMGYAFGLADEKTLQLDTSYDPLSTWRTLSHHISRYPHDLRAHTQRILLGQQYTEVANLLPGSLQDLFLVLENAGYALRNHLLNLSEQHLTNEEFAFFSHWIKQNAKNDKTHNCWQSGSVLSTGSCGGQSLLNSEVQQEVTESEDINVLEEARSCLDNGQLELAQQMLEDELLKSPASAEIEDELLTIYQHSRNKDQLDAMSKKLLDQGEALSEAWKQCQQNSESWG